MLNGTPNWEQIYRDTVYAISHDLGAPVRHVRAFSDILLEGDSGKDKETKEMLRHINTAGSEAQAMLEGLLRLSRVYGQAVHPRVMSSETLCERFDCQNDAERQYAHVCVDLELLDMVTRELADNATQYGEFRGFSVTSTNKEVLILARDAGAGIQDQDWETSLLPLQRVGHRRTHEHVGMGLTIALAIARKLDGELANTPDGVAIVLPCV